MRFLHASIAFGLVATAMVAFAAPLLAKGKDPAQEITSQLICPCSCGEVVSGCICETGMSMKATVENGIKAGKNKNEIIGALVQQYGEVIRGAPKPEGFNLIVWIAPFAATLLGFAIAWLFLRRLVRRRGDLVTAAAAHGDPAGRGTVPFPSGRAPAEDRDSLRARAEAELRQVKQGREA
ncbi:MAG TPA: cytochrome c-type biogenesis protein CcmH [Candidatus Dormibacteraeota bacterium]|nr:cytochrome c-type biogenesis protein CcmH [Candidatus Dormibacteraeota bacterium]